MIPRARIAPMIPSLWWCCLLLLVLTFAASWWLSEKTKNAGLIEVVWSGSFFPLTLLYVGALEGYAPRRVLLLTLVSLWSLRLAFSRYRALQRHPHAEPEYYTRVKARWGITPTKRLAVFQLVGLSVLVLSLLHYQVARNPDSMITAGESFAGLIWIIGFMGSYTRYPKRYFQWLIWIAFFILALIATF